MAQGNEEPSSPLDEILSDVVVDEWGKRGAELAKEEGETLDTHSVSYWLDLAETPRLKELRATEIDLWRDLRQRAEERVQAYARILSIWRP